MQFHKNIVASTIFAFLTGPALASDVLVQSSALELKSSLYGDSVEMSVTGPDNFLYKSKNSGGNTLLSLSQLNIKKDGLYKYEFLEIKQLGQESVVDAFNGREATTRNIVESKKVSGHFHVKNGQIVDSKLIENTFNAHSNK